MTSVEELKKILNETEAPKPLLKCIFGDLAIPIYSYEPLTKMNDGKLHPPVRKNKETDINYLFLYFSHSLWLSYMP